MLTLVACAALLAVRGWLFPQQLHAPRPLTALRLSTELTLYYHERRPYYFEEGGQVRGIVADIAADALQRAAVRFRWVPMPPARQLQELRDSSSFSAGLGWIVTDDRRQFAQYSEPLWQDGVFVAIARAKDARLQPGRTLEDLFNDQQLTLLLKDSYSYGSEVDTLLARLHPPSIRTPSPNDAMLRMIAEERADYFLLAIEEAESLLKAGDASGLRIVPLADAPRGVVRHLMFSRRVPEAVVQRVNTALRQITPRR